MSVVSIGGRRIGDGEECYFLAEVGGNYGSVEDIHRIIDACIRVGIDAVKFQTFEAETLTTRDNFFNLEITGTVQQYELLKKYEPPKELQRELMRYSIQKGIVAFSAPSHMRDLDLLEELNVPAYKIGSDLACHVPLLTEVAQTGKPIVLSTGMATLEEIKLSVETILGINDNLVLMHCVSDYPTHDGDANLRTIQLFKEQFGVPVGYSDHTVGPEVALAAVALGANAIERHFWVQGNQQGPDIALCSDEQEYAYLVKAARRIEKALGRKERILSPGEKANRAANRVSIVAFRDIKKGQTITSDLIDIRRPGCGLAPILWEKVIGARAMHDLAAGKPIEADDVDLNPSSKGPSE